MKIIDIERTNDIFTVTTRPNLIFRFFGETDKIKHYKDIKEKYKHHNNANVYVNQKGEIMGWSNEITIALDNWRRKF